MKSLKECLINENKSNIPNDILYTLKKECRRLLSEESYYVNSRNDYSFTSEGDYFIINFKSKYKYSTSKFNEIWNYLYGNIKKLDLCDEQECDCFDGKLRFKIKY